MKATFRESCALMLNGENPITVAPNKGIKSKALSIVVINEWAGASCLWREVLAVASTEQNFVLFHPFSTRQRWGGEAGEKLVSPHS